LPGACGEGPLASGGPENYAPSWSPDGQWLAYVSIQNGSIDGEHGELFVIPVSGGDAQQVTFTGGSVYNWRADWGP
jgi:Tol biopolymer transport system component